MQVLADSTFVLIVIVHFSYIYIQTCTYKLGKCFKRGVAWIMFQPFYKVYRKICLFEAVISIFFNKKVLFPLTLEKMVEKRN